MSEELKRIGAQMANTMFNLAQRAGDVIDSDLATKFDKMRKEWDAAVRATPSPSTAPTVDKINMAQAGIGDLARGYVNGWNDCVDEFSRKYSDN